MRQLAAPFVAAAPAGARIGTSLFVTSAEHGVLVQMGGHLGRLAGRDLAARCVLGAGPKHKGRAERKRGKRFRRTVAGMPTAQFRHRVVAMSANAGIAIIAVDAAYTTKWGREHWLAHLNRSRRTPCSGHHAAAVMIGRRARQRETAGHVARGCHHAAAVMIGRRARQRETAGHVARGCHHAAAVMIGRRARQRETAGHVARGCHHAAAVMIGRRALGLTAKRRSTARESTTGNRQPTGPRPQSRSCRSKGLQAKPTAPGRDAEEARQPAKRSHRSRPPTAAADSGNTAHVPRHRAQTPKREPAQHRGQGTPTVHGARPAAGESQPLPTR